MGYSISLKGESFNQGGWLENLESCGLEISPMGTQFALILAEHHDNEMWLHPRGGLRGVTVRQAGAGAELSLPSGVSEADFLLAGLLVRTAIAFGAVAEDEEGRILTGTDDEMRELSMTYRQFFWSAITQSIARGETTLPVGGMLNLRIDASELDKTGWLKSESRQLAKMARYEEAYIPSLMQVKGHGTEFLLSNYHHLPTLISTQAEYVSLNGEHGDITDGNPVPANRFLEIIADRVESLGSWIFIPAIDFTKEPELAAKLKAAAGVDAADSLPLSTGTAQATDQKSTSGEITGEDWMRLAKCAIYCLFMIAKADGSVDRKEILTIQNLLESYQSSPNPILAKILGIARASMEQIGQEIQEEELPALAYIAMLVGTLTKIPEHEATQIKAGFLTITQAVAESSGGVFGFGSKVSKNEQAVLDFLKSALA